jgi:glycosyltransferase involved in cell wall biosynthesis
MPNSVLEAFAYGLPIVTTKVGGLIDIFKEPENGVFAEIKDINSLSEAIKYLISNPNILESIAINNYHYALNKFHPSIVTSRLMSIYQEVINLK